MRISQIFTALGLALPITALAMPAMAVDLGNGLSFSGDIRLEDGTGALVTADPYRMAYSDLMFAWRSDAQGALGFGLDLNMVAVKDINGTSGISQEIQFWGGLVATTAVGDFTIGRPRPLLSSLSPVPDFAASPLTELNYGTVGAASFAFTDLNASEFLGRSPDVVGASFVGQSGPWRYGLARHQVEGDTYEFGTTEVTGSYSSNNFLGYAGVERIENAINVWTSVMVGSTYTMGKAVLGAEMIASDMSGTEVNRTRLFGTYDVTDQVELGLQAQQVSSEFLTVNYYGATAAYSFASGAYAKLGLGTTNDADFSDTTSLVVGWKF